MSALSLQLLTKFSPKLLIPFVDNYWKYHFFLNLYGSAISKIFISTWYYFFGLARRLWSSGHRRIWRKLQKLCGFFNLSDIVLCYNHKENFKGYLLGVNINRLGYNLGCIIFLAIGTKLAPGSRKIYKKKFWPRVWGSSYCVLIWFLVVVASLKKIFDWISFSLLFQI